MAIPSVELITSDNVTWRFLFNSGLYIVALPSSLSITITSVKATVFSSSSSSFNIFLDNVCFEFPHSEFKKYKAFLGEVKTAKEVA